MWLEEVRGRERGELRARQFEANSRARRAASLALSNRKEFATPHHGAVNSLQVPLLLPLLPLAAIRFLTTATTASNETDLSANLIEKHIDLHLPSNHGVLVMQCVSRVCWCL